MVSVDVKLYWTMLTHWSQLVPNMSSDNPGHKASPEGRQQILSVHARRPCHVCACGGRRGEVMHNDITLSKKSWLFDCTLVVFQICWQWGGGMNRANWNWNRQGTVGWLKGDNYHWSICTGVTYPTSPDGNWLNIARPSSGQMSEMCLYARQQLVGFIWRSSREQF